jgi:hypothetical protein
MLRWCKEAGLTDVHIQTGGNGLELHARKPAVADVVPVKNERKAQVRAVLQGGIAAAAAVALAIGLTRG